MPTKVIMPQLGESVIEGTITRWLFNQGDRVSEMEPLLEVNTDKVDTEIPSPASGRLTEILVPEGTTVRAGTVLAWIGESAEESNREAVSNTSLTLTLKKPNAFDEPATRPSHVVVPRSGEELGFISPVVAKIAQEHDLDLKAVKGTGLGGRITKKDVLAYLKALDEKRNETAPVIATPEPAIISAVAPLQPAETGTHLPGEVLPLNAVRRTIAEHMVLSKNISPHVTTVMEADMSRVVAHRETNKALFARDGVNLTFTAYIISSAVTALKAHPIVNSTWTEEGILLHRQINIGIATSLGEEGLIVPVIKNADSLSLLGLARTVNDLANRARVKKLLPDEVKGGTFTITNHGTSGSLFATPIINQPQCAILGTGVIQKRVVVINDAIAIRPMVYLTLTFDHRILDGAIADNFLGKVVESLQNWG
jgi:2-oxoglutarate dehydrogenase E2 component (dihydrolipoamide succinyltransferase)